MSSKSKKKKLKSSKPPDMFMLSYAALATLLLAFFIIINTFAEERKKEVFQEFQRSLNRNSVTLGMGGLFSGNDPVKKERIREMKYIFPDQERKRTTVESGDKEVEQITDEEDMVPAAIVVYFKENDTTLSLSGMHNLNNLVDLVQERPVMLMIEGHTRKNFKPSRKYDNSWKLSIDRAKSVADYLHERGNISHKRLIVVGYGNNKPFVKSLKGDIYNDRVDIIINVIR